MPKALHPAPQDQSPGPQTTKTGGETPSGIKGDARFAEIRQQIVHDLSSSTEALAALREAGPKGDEPQYDPTPDALVTQMLGTTWQDAIRWLRESHQEIEARRSDAIERRVTATADNLAVALTVLEAVAKTIVPAIYDSESLRTVIAARDSGGLVCLLACHIETVGEIIMASVDRRVTSFRRRIDRKHYPLGRLQLPAPPEAGIEEPAEGVAQIRTLLNGMFSPGGWSQLRALLNDFLTREFVDTAALAMPGGGGGDWDAGHIKTIAREIANQTFKRKTYYIIYRIPAEASTARELHDGFKQMKADFPALEILGFTGDDGVKNTEQEIFGPFVQMLPVEPSGSIARRA